VPPLSAVRIVTHGPGNDVVVVLDIFLLLRYRDRIAVLVDGVADGEFVGPALVIEPIGGRLGEAVAFRPATLSQPCRVTGIAYGTGKPPSRAVGRCCN
jgi:hypothetical protein